MLRPSCLVSVCFATGHYIIYLITAFYVPNWDPMSPPELPTYTPVLDVGKPKVVSLLPPTKLVSVTTSVLCSRLCFNEQRINETGRRKETPSQIYQE